MIKSQDPQNIKKLPAVTFSKKYVIAVNFIMKKPQRLKILRCSPFKALLVLYSISFSLKGEELTGSYLKATTCGLLRRPQLTQGW